MVGVKSGRSVGMASWPDALLGFRADGGGVLTAYARCLRLIAGLSSGPPMEWLTDRVWACLNPDAVASLASDSAVVALRRRIADADEVSASVLRHLCGLQTGTMGTDYIARSMRSLEQTLDPYQCLQNVMREESRVTDVWAEASELPPAVTFRFQSVRRMELVGRSGASTLLCGENMKRVGPLFSIQHGQGWDQQVSDQPEWVADLVPPDFFCAVFGTKPCDKVAPLEVLYGSVQDMPKWLTLMVVSFEFQHQLIRDSVVRYVPSGACIVEAQGTEMCVPSSLHAMVVPPSMVANVVTTTGVPEFSGHLRACQTAEVGLPWPATLSSDTPWRFFVSIVREEVLFR